MKIKSESFDARVLKWGGGVMLAFLVGTPMMVLSGKAGAGPRDGLGAPAPGALMAACDGKTMNERCTASPGARGNCSAGRHAGSLDRKPKGEAKL